MGNRIMKNAVIILMLLISTVTFSQEKQIKEPVDNTQYSVTKIKDYAAKLDSLVKLNPYVVITYKSTGTFSDTQIEIEQGKKVNARIEAIIPVYEWKVPTYTQDQLFNFIKSEKLKKEIKK